MIILVTGVPGSGKTLYSIGLILDWLKQGRDVYADIDGLNIDGVQPAPDDWRDTPDGSVVVYDECQQRYGPDGQQGRSKRDDIAAMEVHRHTGHDILLITQHPSLLHNHVRRLVGKHHHVSRVLGGNVAKIYTQDKVIKVDSRTDLSASDLQTWPYPKKHFELYQSATVHTHKFRMPNKVKYGLAAMALLVVGAVYMYQTSTFFHPDLKEEGPPEGSTMLASLDTSPAPIAVSEQLPTHEVPLAGCISSYRGCHCYDESMTPIAMDEVQCLNTLAKPLPRRIAAVNGRTSGAPSQPQPQRQAAPKRETVQLRIPDYVD